MTLALMSEPCQNGRTRMIGSETSSINGKLSQTSDSCLEKPYLSDYQLHYLPKTSPNPLPSLLRQGRSSEMAYQRQDIRGDDPAVTKLYGDRTVATSCQYFVSHVTKDANILDVGQ